MKRVAVVSRVLDGTYDDENVGIRGDTPPMATSAPRHLSS